MIGRDNAPGMQLRGIEVTDMAGQRLSEWQLQHLIEVAIIQGAIPAYGQSVAAHDAGGCNGIKGVSQPRHIPFIIAASDQEIEKAANRHIRERIEVIKGNAVLPC